MEEDFGIARRQIVEYLVIYENDVNQSSALNFLRKK